MTDFNVTRELLPDAEVLLNLTSSDAPMHFVIVTSAHASACFERARPLTYKENNKYNYYRGND